jgi:hypothetical protein
MFEDPKDVYQTIDSLIKKGYLEEVVTADGKIGYRETLKGRLYAYGYQEVSPGEFIEA